MTKCVVCHRSAYTTHVIQVFLIVGLGTRLYATYNDEVNHLYYAYTAIYKHPEQKQHEKKVYMQYAYLLL